MKFTVLDTVTGETREVEDNDKSAIFQWEENNNSCDCNRCTPFGLDAEDLGKEDGYCFGEERFIVTGVIGDMKGRTLQDFNRGYPDELLRKHGVIK